MDKNEHGKLAAISLEELAQIGNGALSYIKEVEGRDANGSPISISGTREGAVSSADEHELIAVTLH